MIELNLELEIHENLNEAFWKVRIPDLPPMFIEAGSSGQIKVDMRKKLKSSLMDDISIERVSKTEMIKKLFVYLCYKKFARGVLLPSALTLVNIIECTNF